MIDYILIPDRISTKTNCHDRFEVLTKYENNPIFYAEEKWEGNLVGWPSFMYDENEKIYKMWYLCVSDEILSNETLNIDNKDINITKSFICYATSKDGINFKREKLNILYKDIYKDNNILIENMGKYIDGPAVIYDEHAKDSEKYKMTYYEHAYKKQGVHTLVSKDGITWNEIGEFPVLPSQDALKFYFDSEKTKYYLFLKDRIQNRRSRLLSSSDDFRNWSEPQTIVSPNLGDSETTNFYDLFVFKYGDVNMAFLTIFDSSTQVSHSELVHVDKNMNIKRFHSRPIVLNRGDDFDWDRGGIYTTSGYLFEQENNIMKYYYYGSTRKHDNLPTNNEAATGFGIAFFNKNRLTGQQFLGEGQFVTTSLLVKGKKLYINAKTSSPIKIEIASCGYPKSFERYSFNECNEIVGDNYMHEVKFNNKNDISEFIGKYVKIKVKGKNSIVYGFTFE